MELWQALLLGLFQGAMEVLPVSSTAHLVLLHAVMGTEGSTLAFDVMMNFGSWLAVMIYLRQSWLDMIVGILNFIKIRIYLFLKDKSWKTNVPGFHDMNVPYQKNDFYYQSRKQGLLACYLIIGTIPAGIIGLLYRNQIDELLRTPFFVALALIIGGILLWVADITSRQKYSLDTMKWYHSFLIGIGQIFALVPGFSRSGSTITAGLFVGFTRKDAATFSFLLGAPIVLAATLSSLPEFITTYQFSFPTIVAFIASIGATFVSMHLFYQFIEKQSYLVFVIYRILLGFGILGVLTWLSL